MNLSIKRPIIEVLVSIGIFFGLLFAMDTVACRTDKPVVTPSVVEAGVGAANGVCSFVEGLDDSGVTRTICATIEEIGQIVAFILTLRSIDGGPVTAANEPCTNLPGTTFCATKRETAKGILFLATEVRARRFMRDAAATP